MKTRDKEIMYLNEQISSYLKHKDNEKFISRLKKSMINNCAGNLSKENKNMSDLETLIKELREEICSFSNKIKMLDIV